jgi:drug/metabolite transporter (DMT)-like permease
MRRLATNPIWLIGGAFDLAAFGLQAWALHLGQVSVVQPLLVAGLFVAVPLGAALDRTRPARRDVLAIGACAVALAVLMASARPHDGKQTLGVAAGAGVGLVTVALTIGCLRLAAGAPPNRRGTLLGAAAGILYGVTAVLTKVCAGVLADDPIRLFTSWAFYALLAGGWLGYSLTMNAFQAGPLAGGLAAMTVLDPVVAAVLGVTVLHEQISTGPALAPLQVFCVVVIVYGIRVLALATSVSAGRSPRADPDCSSAPSGEPSPPPRNG